mgnify:CR=1 FL=1
MRRTIQLFSVVLLAFVFVAGTVACNNETATGGKNKQKSSDSGWSLDGKVSDDGTSGTDGSGSDTAPSDATSQEDSTSPDTSQTADSSGGGSDTQAKADTSTPGDGGSQMGKQCSRNNACGSGEVCCPTWENMMVTGRCRPESQCRYRGGGLCKDKSDCAQGDECCDARGSNKICLSECYGDGMPCNDNSECSGGAVCCPNVSGGGGGKAGTCEMNCLTGGLCSNKSQCSSNEKCCKIPRVPDKVCSQWCP